MTVLWLASWYPSRVEPYNGDFVQRHAEAVSLFHDVVVFHVIKVPGGKIKGGVREEVQQRGRLTEHLVYYRGRFEGFPLLGRLYSRFTYRKVFKQKLRRYLNTSGKPDLVHLHVCLKAAPLALWLRRAYGLPYVVTEHATHFLAEDEKNRAVAAPLSRTFYRQVLRKAKAVTVVSNYLGQAIERFCGCPYRVIPNVVNTDIFWPRQGETNRVCRFIHVSGLGQQKNVEGILAAFALLGKSRPCFALDIVGPEKASLRQLVHEAGLESAVTFHPEMPQPALALLVQRADALVLFSRYETFGCVLIEANACGVPVIVNDFPVMKELVKEGFNGLLSANSPAALATALVRFMDGEMHFDKSAIAAFTHNTYGYEPVGHAFSQVYDRVLQP